MASIHNCAPIDNGIAFVAARDGCAGVHRASLEARQASMPLYYLEELHCHLRLHGLRSSDFLADDNKKRYENQSLGPFRDWASIPPVVCVVLTVPRDTLERLAGPRLPFNPTVTAVLDDEHGVDNFACLESGFGYVRAVGTGENAIPVIDEEPHGKGGGAPWVVSFFAPAHLLARDPEQTSVSIAIVTTIETALFDSLLGTSKIIFRASLKDPMHVGVFAQRPTISEDHPLPIVYALPAGPATPPGIKFPNVKVALTDEDDKDKDCPEVKSFTLRTLVDDDAGKAILASNTPGVKVEQVTHSEMLLTMGADWSRRLQFPFSVNGSTAKLRVARSSGWIEVCTFTFVTFIAELSYSSKVIAEMGSFDKCSQSLDRFPVIRHQGVDFLWNMHLILPNRSPRLALDQPHLLKWVGLHMRFAYSDKERHALDRQRNQSTLVQLKKMLRGNLWR